VRGDGGVNDVPLLRAEVPDLADALYAGALLRAAGGTFDATFRFPDDRAVIANSAARDVIAGAPDAATRLAALDALAAYDARIGTTMLADLTPLSRAQHEAARDFFMLARFVRVRSNIEYITLSLQLGMLQRWQVAAPASPDVPVPHARGERGNRIVVWAPERRTNEFPIVLAGACADGAPVDVVCAGGEGFGYAARLIGLADAAQALAHADVIVDATLDDAGASVALAAWGRALCAPATNGAGHWLRGLTTYRPWSRVDVTAAIAFARARPVPLPTVMAPLPEPSAMSVPSGGPRVRIVVRSDAAAPCALTQRALERLAYADCEIVIVHAEEEARARARADGATFVLYMDDGDTLYADAISQLVGALERSGEDRARGDAVVTYLVEAPGPPHTLGHAVVGPHAPDMDARDGLPFRTLVRRSRLLGGDADAARTVRIDAPLGSAHRYLDGRSAFLASAPARPTRRPALPLAPPRPLGRD
jgi:hypothetical protein